MHTLDIILLKSTSIWRLPSIIPGRFPFRRRGWWFFGFTFFNGSFFRGCRGVGMEFGNTLGLTQGGGGTDFFTFSLCFKSGQPPVPLFLLRHGIVCRKLKDHRLIGGIVICPIYLIYLETR